MSIPQLPVELWHMIVKFKKELELRDKELCRKIYTPWTSVYKSEKSYRGDHCTIGPTYRISYSMCEGEFSIFKRITYHQCLKCSKAQEIQYLRNGKIRIFTNLHVIQQYLYNADFLELESCELRNPDTYSREWKIAHERLCSSFL